MKLKTLKELGHDDKWIGRKALKEEAIKWIKERASDLLIQANIREAGDFDVRKNRWLHNFIKFFDITEEDLNEGHEAEDS